MRKLTQAIFDGQPDWVKSAAVDADGDAYFYSIKKGRLLLLSMDSEWWSYRHVNDATCDYIGAEFDATDWRNSAIDRA